MITAMEPPLRNVQVAVKKNLRPVFFTRKNGSPLIIFLTFPHILLKDVGENRPFSKDVCLAPAAVQEATASCCHPTATSG